MFHNAHEYRTLYPEAPMVRRVIARRAATTGYEVEAARRRIACAGRTAARADERRLGAARLSTRFERPRHRWLGAERGPSGSAGLSRHICRRRVDRPDAGEPLPRRSRAAGLGSGRHSFEFKLPAGLTFAPNAIVVRRSFDGTVLDRFRNGPRLSALTAWTRITEITTVDQDHLSTWHQSVTIQIFRTIAVSHPCLAAYRSPARIAATSQNSAIFFQQAARLLNQGPHLATLFDPFTSIQAVLERVLVATGRTGPGSPPCTRQRLLPPIGEAIDNR